MAAIACPSCGEDDDLRGEQHDDEVIIVCGPCGATFSRDLTPRCTACGSDELVARPTNLLEDKGRGDMTTPTGIVDKMLCWGCGAMDATARGAVSAGPNWRAERAQSGLLQHLRTRD